MAAISKSPGASPGSRLCSCSWIKTGIVVGPHAKAECKLLEIADARDALSAAFGLRERGQQQQSREKGNDGDDDQQFDQGKAAKRAKCLFAQIISCNCSGTAHWRS